MATTAQTFRATGSTGTDNDYTDPTGGDLRKFVETTPTGSDTTTQANFGTSGNKDITFDPYTNRSTTGITDGIFGLTVNLSGSDGMAATSTRYRRTLAGTWSIVGAVGTTGATALNVVTVHARVYKRNSDGSRTLLGSGSDNVGLLTTAGAGYSITTGSIAATEFQANETFIVQIHINATGQVGGLTVVTDLGAPLVGSIFAVTVPSPGVRSRYLETPTTIIGDCVAPAALRQITTTPPTTIAEGDPTGAKAVTAAKTFTLAGEGDPTFDRETIASRTFALTGEGDPTYSRQVVAAKSFDLAAEGVVDPGSLVIAMTDSVTAEGDPTGTKAVVAARSFDLAGEGVVPIENKAVTLGDFDLVADADVDGTITIPIDEVPEGGGGGDTFIRPTYIFD